MLEYYAGVLFLTTNRIGDFDEAFASRIHMSLHYPPLDRLSTSRVFKLNLDMIKARYEESDRKIKIDETEILDDVGEYWRQHEKARLNGRQIRNACQTALALAEFDAQPEGRKYDLKARPNTKVHLTLKNVTTVSDAYREFINYLSQIHGTDAETHAKESGLRALETVIAALKTGTRSSSGARLSAHQDEERERPLHKFKLGQRSQAGPSTTMRQQPQHSQPQAYEASQAHFQRQPSPSHQGHGGHQGSVDGTADSYHAHADGYSSHNIADTRYSANIFPGMAPHQQQQHQHIGQHQMHPLAASVVGGPRYQAPGIVHLAPGQDPHTGGVPSLDPMSNTPHWSHPSAISAAEAGQGGRTTLNPGTGPQDYDQRRGAGSAGGYSHDAARGHQ